MKGLNPRQKKLIYLLIQNERFLPVSFYSKKLDKSNRTIYSDLNKIQILLTSEKLILEKKPRIGIQLKGTVEAKMQFLERITGIKTESVIESQERQLLIAEQLLIDEETVTQQMLAQQFHVSPSSIVTDLDKIIEKYRLTLVSSKQGTKIVGSEEEIQNSLFRFCEDYLNCHEINIEQLFHKKNQELFFNLNNS